MIKELKKYMFWEVVQNCVAVIYLILFGVSFISGNYVWLGIGMLFLLVTPVASIFKFVNAWRMAKQ